MNGNGDPELLIWVDEQGREIGRGEKLETHRLGQLHLAFSLFLWDPERKQLLLQKRAQDKYHSGGCWSNSCCSHPRAGETLSQAVSRCLWEELGIQATFPEEISTGGAPEPGRLWSAGTFVYRAALGDLTEHELDRVLILLGSARDPVPFRTEEVAQVQWISPEDLEPWLEREPEAFSAWFPHAYRLFRHGISRTSAPQML